MNEKLQSRIGLKGLEFGEGGGRTKEVVIGAALAIIVVAALVLALYHVFSGPKPKEETLHMHCLKCGYEFTIKNRDLPEDAWDMKTFEIRLDCPECGAKKSCVQMMQCPSCGKWFVKPKEGPLRCPYCKVNVTKYVKERAKKK